MAEQLLIVKLTQAQIALVGATSASDFPDKLSAHAAAAKQIETAMAESPDLKAFESRIASLETAVKSIPTDARIGEIVGASVATSVPAAMGAWASSDAGKKLIGAEASRITAEALAAVGTQPAKPAPASAEAPDHKTLVGQGKFEEAFALLAANEQAEFGDAKAFAAYHKASAKGQVRIVTR